MPEAVSLLTPEATEIISGFAANLPVTVLALVAIIIPTGLSLWAMGLGLKKGINYLKTNARQAV